MLSVVDKLWFPVKLGLHVRVMLGALAIAALLVSCGYHAVYGASRPSARLSVVAAPHRVPELHVVQAALAATRAELSQAGVLKPGSAHPRLIVEILRVDELSAGIARAESSAGAFPIARGSTVAVVGRAWVELSPGAAERDSGDMRRLERYASGADTRVDAVRREAALRSAARRLGRALARRILGDPEPAIEPM